MGFIVVVFFVAVICFLIDHVFHLTGDLIFWLKFGWITLNHNWLLSLGFGCFALAIFVLVYFKPHPAEKYFLAYKDGKVEQKEAIKQMAATMYNWRTTGLPAAWKSKIRTKRVNALNERLKAEHAFMQQLIAYMRSKNMFQ